MFFGMTSRFVLEINHRDMKSNYSSLNCASKIDEVPFQSLFYVWFSFQYILKVVFYPLLRTKTAHTEAKQKVQLQGEVDSERRRFEPLGGSGRQRGHVQSTGNPSLRPVQCFKCPNPPTQSKVREKGTEGTVRRTSSFSATWRLRTPAWTCAINWESFTWSSWVFQASKSAHTVKS